MYNDKQIQPASAIPLKHLTQKKSHLGTFSTDAYERVKSLEIELESLWGEINPLLQETKVLKRKRCKMEARLEALGDQIKDLWAEIQNLKKKGWAQEAREVMRDRRRIQANRTELEDELNELVTSLRPMFKELNKLFEKKDAVMSQITALDPTRVYRRYQDRSQRARPNEQELAAEKVNTELKRRWDKKNGQTKSKARERAEENQPKAGKHDFYSFRRLWGESKGRFMARLEILHTININS